MGCCSQKTAALHGLALITRSDTSSSSSYLGRRPFGRQQPRWKAPTPATGRGADNGRGIHYKGIHTYIHAHRLAQLPHGLVGLLKEAAAPFPLSEMLNTFPLSQPWWETDSEENASKALGCPRKGGLCAPHKPALAMHHTEKKPFSMSSRPPKTLSFIFN